MISFVHAEPEVTLKMDHVVYSDDNLFSHTRNCLTNMISFMLCAIYTRWKLSEQQQTYSLSKRLHFRIYRDMQILDTDGFFLIILA